MGMTSFDISTDQQGKTTFKEYRKVKNAELRPYVKGELNDVFYINNEDLKNGSPKEGDMIARNPNDHDHKWLVTSKDFLKSYEEIL